MIEKLTPGTAHLTRSGVPVYLVNSHSHMQAVHRTCSRPLDVGIERSSARMSGSRPMGDAHPSNAAADCGHAQTLNISRAMRESWRKSLRAGRCSRFGRASLLDVTNAAVKDARTALVQRRVVLAGRNGTAAAVANSTCCSVIKTGTRGDASAASCSTASRGAPNGSRNSDISVPLCQVTFPSRWIRPSDGRNFRPVISDPHE